jgi:hypothetical protein
MPVPMEHINEIAVLSHSGQVANLMRGQGAVYHRLLPSSAVPSSADSKVKRQFQQPAFSLQGKYLALAEMHFRESSVVRSDALVFEIPKDPKTFGSSDSMPLFSSGELPGAPFFLRFSPDDETLAMLCSQPASETGTGAESSTSLVLLDWARYQRKDSWAGQVASSRLSPRKALTVLRGSPVFFTYTTSAARNATIVAHCQQEVADPVSKSMVTERAVWMLSRADTSGVADFGWKKISTSDPASRWSTPICHSAGGGDSVLVVEDGWLVSKSLSRWKRAPSGEPRTKKLLELRGQAQFLVAPDNSKAVVLQEDVSQGHYRLTVIEGEKALDPADPSSGSVYEIPCPKLAVAFWFSPDSTKVLLLTSATKMAADVAAQKGQARVALNSDMQWSVYNFPLSEVREYEAFKPTPYFMKVRLCVLLLFLARALFFIS